MTVENGSDPTVERLIRGSLAPVDDAGFSESIVRRVRRQLWARRVTLAGAATAGALLALPFAADAVIALSGQIVAFADQWGRFGGSADLAPVVDALPAREALLQFGRELAEIGANWNEPDRLAQWGIALPAGLAALLSPLAVWMLER